MKPGRRQAVMSIAQELQARYATSRQVWARSFRELVAAGAFVAPAELRVGPQLELGLGEPLRLDTGLAEAA